MIGYVATYNRSSEPVSVYVAAPLGCQSVARDVADKLGQNFRVTSTWHLEPRDDSNQATNRWAAHVNMDQIRKADLLVVINPEDAPGSGRHAEVGAALALGKRVVLVGARSNVFHFHGNVHQVDQTPLGMRQGGFPAFVLSEALGQKMIFFRGRP